MSEDAKVGSGVGAGEVQDHGIQVWIGLLCCILSLQMISVYWLKAVSSVNPFEISYFSLIGASIFQGLLMYDISSDNREENLHKKCPQHHPPL